MSSQEQALEQPLQHTPLYKAHQRSNARLVPFAGWDMPVLYTSILDEARAVRTASGIFDISHMGRILLHGAGTTDLLQRLTSNNVAALTDGQAQYSLLTNPKGGIIDDIIVYRQGEERFLVVINASNTDKDIAWIKEHLPASVTLEDNTVQTAMIAVQGPKAPELVSRLTGLSSLLELPRFHWTTGTVEGAAASFCRTGYTGEDGFEVIIPADKADSFWSKLEEEGALPCGLGARDALRIEAGYPLYGHEIDDTTSPVEALLMWAVSLEKGEFTGREEILKTKQAGIKRRLVGLSSLERIIPRQGYTIYASGEQENVEVGRITSGIFSPTKNHSLAMGYVNTPWHKTGTTVEIGIRDKRSAATVMPKKAMLDPEL